VFGLWSTTQCPPHHTTKLKISHWYFDQWLYLINTYLFCPKNILSNRFSAQFFHSHRPTFSEMFIINGKSHCCNDTFLDVRFTSLLTKNIEEYKLFYAVWISILLAICLKFSFKFKSNWLLDLRVFFLNTVHTAQSPIVLATPIVFAARLCISASYERMPSGGVCPSIRHIRGLCQNEYTYLQNCLTIG